MRLKDRIDQILKNDALDEDDYPEDTCKVEEIEKVNQHYSWKEIEHLLIDMLLEDRRVKDYQTIAAVIWGACLDKRDFTNRNKIIALLYKRLPNDEDSIENNLAWSIVTKLKNVGYLSDYDPLEDPMVQKEINKLPCM